MSAQDEQCDFCGEEQPHWWFPAQDILVVGPGLAGNIGSAGGWVACATCALAVEDERYGDLLERLMQAYMARAGQADAVVPPYPETEARLRELCQGIVTAFLRARTGPGRRRTPAPQPLARGGDLSAYIDQWRDTWRKAPVNLIGDADRRAADLRDALGSWQVDLGNPVVRRALWGLLAVVHADAVSPNLTATLAALLASAEVGT